MDYSPSIFKNGKFHNINPAPVSSPGSSFFSVLYEFFFNKSKEAYPDLPLPARKIDLDKLGHLAPDEVCVNWLGHSTVLITSQDISIITDPVFIKNKLSPFNLGPKKFPYEVDYQVEDLPKIDLVLISHDHYDHLDKRTVLKLKESKFMVPLGVKSRLVKWGIEAGQVTEFDWYQEADYSENLYLAFCPAQHFSGRSLFDGNKTLWGSWVMHLRGKTLYFGGDSGYSAEFKKIGEKYGPFDLAMLEDGQYNTSWKHVHMMPEEAVQAGIDLKAKSVLPIHNSKYVLSIHSWYEPLERLVIEAKNRGLAIVTPIIGACLVIGKDKPDGRWWV